MGFYAHLAVVDSDDGANHFWDNNHVPEVGLDHGGLFIGRRLLLGLSQLLDQTQGLALEAAVETPTGASMDNLKCAPAQINQEGNGRREAIRTSTSYKEGGVSQNRSQGHIQAPTSSLLRSKSFSSSMPR